MTKTKFKKLLSGYNYPEFLVEMLYKDAGETLPEDADAAVKHGCDAIKNNVGRLEEMLENFGIKPVKHKDIPTPVKFDFSKINYN